MMILSIISRLTIEMVEKTVKAHSTDFSSSIRFSPFPQPAAKPLPDSEENNKNSEDN
ncbi:MAG: hypothetical protein K0R55_4678 [Sporomusa sp.]|nr:hypothetical protein [Sporomusa sp.]